MGTLDVKISSELRTLALDVELSCPAGVLALVGPSGAGKSTVLRAIAGLHPPAAGRIALGDDVWFDSRTATDLPPERRSVGMVFQEYALFPHLSVAGNVAFGADGDVGALLERLSIAHLAQARVQQISGGERQRVALARALAREPSVLLLDEPLAALDTHTRTQVRGELGATLRAAGLPTVLVTHDFADAAALADDVAVLVDGAIRQRSSPFGLRNAPADAFVASFTGATVIDAAVSDGELILANGARLRAPRDAVAGPVTVAAYPWEVELSPDGIEATIVAMSPQAGATRIETDVLPLDVSTAAAEGLRTGERIRLSATDAALRLFPRA